MSASLVSRLKIKLFERAFHKLGLSDRPWVDAACQADGNLSPHACFVMMYLTQAEYADEYYRSFNGCVVKKPWIESGVLQCQYPIGEPEKRKLAVQQIVDLYSPFCSEVVFFGASEESLAELREMFGNRLIRVESTPDDECYIVDVQEQIELPGGEFRNKRKKIVRFHNNFNWTCEPITDANMEDCLAVNAAWLTEHAEDEDALSEQRSLETALRELDTLKLQGVLFRIEGKPAAIYIGTPFNKDMYLSLFMKADNSYRDITLAFTQEFFKRYCQDFRYDNEGADEGMEGLRKFKSNLHPKFKVPFYYATVTNTKE